MSFIGSKSKYLIILILLILSSNSVYADGLIGCFRRIFNRVVSSKVNKAPSRIVDVDYESEPWPEAFIQINNRRYYYSDLIGQIGEAQLSQHLSTEKTDGTITNRDFKEVCEMTGLSEEYLSKNLANSKILSVGEGNSNFVETLQSRGMRAIGIDAQVEKPGIVLKGFAQNLPFDEGEFDLTLSNWLMPHFFRPSSSKSTFNPPAGRKAILEMIRVTKIGGEVRISPVRRVSGVIDFLDILVKFGFIEYHVVEKGVSIPIEYYPAQEQTRSDEFSGLFRRDVNEGKIDGYWAHIQIIRKR